MISILISTRNRPSQLKECLNSIFVNTYKNFEVLIIDQSTNSETKDIVKKFDSKKIIYEKIEEKGKAKALNKMIKTAKNEILAFTDDDCIVDKHWLEEINRSFQEQPQISGVFGNAYPYEPEKHPFEICPALFKTNNESAFHQASIVHYKVLGQGNNMSLRKSVINEVGNFNEWLGTGSISRAGEEGDLIFKILLNGHTLITNPKIIVFHNRWLTKSKESLQQSYYSRGIMAFSSYYLLSDHNAYARKFIKIRFSDRIITILNQIRILSVQLLKQIFLFFFEIINITAGLFIGLVMAVKKRIEEIFKFLS